MVLIFSCRRSIDLRFLFGESKTVLDDELKVETTPWDMESEMTLYSVEKMEEDVIKKTIPINHAVCPIVAILDNGG